MMDILFILAIVAYMILILFVNFWPEKIFIKTEKARKRVMIVISVIFLAVIFLRFLLKAQILPF